MSSFSSGNTRMESVLGSSHEMGPVGEVEVSEVEVLEVGVGSLNLGSEVSQDLHSQAKALLIDADPH